MKKLITMLLGISLWATADENRPGNWESVTFTVTDQETKASAKLEGTDKLSKAVLSLNGKLMEIPEEELAEIENPQLGTADILFGEGYYGPVKDDEEPIPHCVIELEFGERSAFGNYSKVTFLFHSGAYQEQTVMVQETEVLWKNFQKYPGEDPIEVGTTTVAPHRPENPADEDGE